MKPLKYMQAHNHEQLAFWNDEETKLKAIIAIHDTTLGPALGGVRMWRYDSEEAAVRDALRLSEAMTYKASVAGLNFGGGKAVIIGDPSSDKSEALFRSFGRFVESLNGRYISAEDVGTDVDDLAYVRKETPHVTGLSKAYGGSGDPSPVTAFGVYQGMKAACQHIFGTDSLKGRTIAIQGLGKVGYALAERLKKEEATVIAVKLNPQVATQARDNLGVELVDPEEIYSVECEIFAPCALGAVINDDTISQLRCQIIAGSANNQLAAERHGNDLHDRGILYVPDYVINAGGLISVASELGTSDAVEVHARTRAIYDSTTRVIYLAEQRKVSTHQAAYQLAKERIEHQRQPQRHAQVTPDTPATRLAA